jgi:hypothetical protein
MWRYPLALVVSAGIIAGSMYLYQHRNQLFRPDFDRTGGTLVVFEIDDDPPAGGLDELIEVLHKRFDPTGTEGFVVRADGERRVCVGVPDGKLHDELIQTVKRVAPRPGVLQFRILANATDDEAAWLAASVPAAKAKLDAPPPPLRDAGGADEFAMKIPHEPPHRYRWLPVSDGQLKMMFLDPGSLKRDNPWDEPVVENSCRTGTAFTPRLMEGCLVQARKLPGQTDPAYFLLVREPAAGQDVKVGALENVRASGSRAQYNVYFRIHRDRRKTFDEMVRKNASMPGASAGNRRITLVLDGKVTATPMLFQVSQRECQFDSGLSREEADDLVLLLQGGALPCRLKPKPVRETTVGKRK